jgi:hypothetical protein
MTGRRALTQLQHRVGRRGASLLCFGALDFVYGYWLQSDADPTSAVKHWFCTLMPLGAWALIWWSVGMVCVVFAFVHDDYPGFAGAIGIKLTWGIFSLIGWLADGVGVGSVGIWVGLAIIVAIIAGWAEPEIHGDDAS